MDYNNGIGCTVCECEHHTGSSNKCKLSNVSIGKNAMSAHNKDNTVCDSFSCKK